MKSALLCFVAIAFALLVSSCSDDPVSTNSSHAVASYHGTLISLDGWFDEVVDTAPNDVYAVGSVILHYNGKAWTPVPLPHEPSSVRMGAAFADGKFVFSDSYDLFLRDNGRWITIDGPGYYLGNLWGPSITDLYGIGYEGISHFDGISWTPVALPRNTYSPFAMAGRSTSDIVTTGTIDRHYGAIYHFDGSQWSIARVDSFYSYNSLAMTQSGRVFAGDYSRVFELTGPTPQIILDDELDDAVLCADGDVLYAAGPVRYHPYRDPQFSIRRYANGAWQEVIKEKGLSRGFWAANGALVAAGENNLIWRGTDQGGQVDESYPRRSFMTCAINIDDAIYAAGEGAYRYENGVWTDLKKEYVSKNMAWAIAGRTDRDVYAVGDMMVMHYDGDKWSWINGGFGVQLGAAWVDTNGDLFAAGGASIFRKHRDEWSTETIPGDPRGVYDMWGSDDAVYAVGTHGLIAVRRNGRWQAMASGTSSDLVTIWGFDDKHVYAAGDNNNELCSYDGRTWQPVAITTADLENFQSIWGRSPSDFWAADYRGIIAHYDGRQWSELERILPSDLIDVCGNSRETLVFGRNGVISYHP